jgi:hypothetical protein
MTGAPRGDDGEAPVRVRDGLCAAVVQGVCGGAACVRAQGKVPYQGPKGPHQRPSFPDQGLNVS